MNKTIFIALSCILLFATSCNNGKKKNTEGLKDIEITIDWVPVAEYYGFYYAKHSGIFKEYGYNVTIKNGTGAPDVATQIGTGNILIGTSTSDNILRRYADGHKFSAVRKIFNFNPSSVVTLKENNINKISDLYGKTLGVNIKASPYEQLMALILNDRSIPLEKEQFKEYPIEYGGAVQLLNKDVDAFLAYTTNQAIDVSLKNNNAKEIFLGDLGIYSYGLVLAFADDEVLRKNGLTEHDVNMISEAVIKGYDKGLTDIDNAVKYLKENDQLLDEKKVREGILKIGKLNKTVVYPHKHIDSWIKDARITDDKRNEVLKLYTTVAWEKDGVN